jgi:hypothetical protein
VAFGRSAQLLIACASSSRDYLQWLESGKPDKSPEDVPFQWPEKARKGDRYLLFVAGSDSTYVGWGTVTSDWSKGRSGAWKGEWFITRDDHLLRTPVLGSHVLKATRQLCEIPCRNLRASALKEHAAWQGT